MFLKLINKEQKELAYLYLLENMLPKIDHPSSLHISNQMRNKGKLGTSGRKKKFWSWDLGVICNIFHVSERTARILFLGYTW